MIMPSGHPMPTDPPAESFGLSYAKEQARLLTILLTYPSPSAPVIAMIGDCLSRAECAAEEKDTAAMLSVYKEMQGFDE